MDINVRAFRVVQEAISGKAHFLDEKKSASRKGGLVGGPARARSISAEKRREIAQKASNARWRKKDGGNRVNE